MRKNVSLTTVEKCILKDLIKGHINEIIEEQKKKNLKAKRKGTLNEFEPTKNLDKYDTDELDYINQLEKIGEKIKLSKYQQTIEQNLYHVPISLQRY